jgi:hypothetical protein|tara:strand:+ start:8286 stop:8477 length:192 start_codon:yes stop_codon:yes gene_type:complete
MKTDEQLIQMNYDELRTEAQEAMDYWQKVISFRDFKKQIPDMEQFVANVLEKQGVEMVTGEEE